MLEGRLSSLLYFVIMTWLVHNGVSSGWAWKWRIWNCGWRWANAEKSEWGVRIAQLTWCWRQMAGEGRSVGGKLHQDCPKRLLSSPRRNERNKFCEAAIHENPFSNKTLDFTFIFDFYESNLAYQPLHSQIFKQKVFLKIASMHHRPRCSSHLPVTKSSRRPSIPHQTSLS